MYIILDVRSQGVAYWQNQNNIVINIIKYFTSYLQYQLLASGVWQLVCGAVQGEGQDDAAVTTPLITPGDGRPTYTEAGGERDVEVS